MSESQGQKLMFILTIQVYIYLILFRDCLGDEFGIYFVDTSRKLNYNNDVFFFDNLAVN